MCFTRQVEHRTDASHTSPPMTCTRCGRQGDRSATSRGCADASPPRCLCAARQCSRSMGWGGQANYGAAARCSRGAVRREAGQTAMLLSYGPWEGAGLANDQPRAAMSAAGMTALDPRMLQGVDLGR